VDGVTTILDETLPTPEALHRWERRQVAALGLRVGASQAQPVGDPDEVLRLWQADRQAMLDAGTARHADIERVLTGGPGEPTPLMRGAAAVVEHLELQTWACEQPGVRCDADGRPLYGGTVDLVGETSDGDELLLDWKTTDAAAPAEGRLREALQVAAYCGLAVESGQQLAVDRAAIARISTVTGAASVSELADLDACWDLWCAVLAMHRRLRADPPMRVRRIRPPDPGDEPF